MIAQFSIVPIGKDEDLGGFVADIIKIVEKSGLPYSLNAMGTVVEGEWDEVMTLLKDCRDEALKTSGRILINMTIDDRPAKPMNRMKEKIESVKRRLGEG